MIKILLYGPKQVNKKTVYGGGVGGYTRNMAAYQAAFQTVEFSMIPCHHSVRGEYRLFVLIPFIRLVRDLVQLMRSIYRNKPGAIHILAQYRGAVVRELAVSVISWAFSLKTVYDIKAGAFESSYTNGSYFYRSIISVVIRHSNLILVEGKRDITFIHDRFRRTAYHFPNFVLSQEIPSPRMTFDPAGSSLRLLFVGYAYKKKGVFEVLDALVLAHKKFPAELTLIGEEHPDFSQYLNQLLTNNPSLVVNRLGVLPHQRVLEIMRTHNVYVYPTSHEGEGHNNSINEAMMHCLNIITTCNGFLFDVLGDRFAHHMTEVTSQNIYGILKRIRSSPEDANRMTLNAYEKLVMEYSSISAISRLEKYYKKALI